MNIEPGFLIDALQIGGLETVFMRHNVGQQPQALGKGAIVAVYVINNLNNLDLTANNVEVMLGGENGQPEQLLPGQSSTLTYATDLEHVYARVRNTLSDDDPPEIVLADNVDVTLKVYRKPTRNDER